MWDIKYRPRSFRDVLGQESNCRVLLERVRRGSGFGTSYIFSGSAGNGKTTLGRILARALFCSSPVDGEPCDRCTNCVDMLADSCAGFTEMDAATGGTVDNIRAFTENLDFVLPGIEKRILLLDEAHRLSPSAQDALLKPVEEKKLVCIFCTTEPDRLKGPIHTRCEPYRLRKIGLDALVERATKVLILENVGFEPEAVQLVVKHGNGAVRDILNNLEFLSQLGDISLENVQEYLRIGTNPKLLDLLAHVEAPDQSLRLLSELLEDYDAGDLAQRLAALCLDVFKTGQSIPTNLLPAETARAQQVWAKLGTKVVGLAERLLEIRTVAGLETALLKGIVEVRTLEPAAHAISTAVSAPPPSPPTPSAGVGVGVVNSVPGVINSVPSVQAGTVKGTFKPNLPLKPHEAQVKKPFPRSTGNSSPVPATRPPMAEFFTPLEWRASFLQSHFPQRGASK